MTEIDVAIAIDDKLHIAEKEFDDCIRALGGRPRPSAAQMARLTRLLGETMASFSEVLVTFGRTAEQVGKAVESTYRTLAEQRQRRLQAWLDRIRESGREPRPPGHSSHPRGMRTPYIIIDEPAAWRPDSP